MNEEMLKSFHNLLTTKNTILEVGFVKKKSQIGEFVVFFSEDGPVFSMSVMGNQKRLDAFSEKMISVAT